MAAQPFTQENRAAKIKTGVLDDEHAVIERLTAHEAISQPFHIEIDLACKRGEKPDALLGKPLTVAVELPEQPRRFWNGIVSRVSRGRVGTQVQEIRLEVVPQLWLLTRTADCRIFQQKSIPDILHEVLGEGGVTGTDTSGITGQHDKWDYCVQYRETDYNFACRLMEEEGIYYWFTHQNGSHTLHLADDIGANATNAQAKLRFPNKETPDLSKGEVREFRRDQEVAVAKYVLRDYNFEDTRTDLTCPATAEGPPAQEVFDYPGGYVKQQRGGRLARYRMEAEVTAAHHAEAGCDRISLLPGTCFELENHPDADRATKYLITSTTHSLDQGVGQGEGGNLYENRFTCIPHRVGYRPLQRTPKPVVQGPHTAQVVGPSGEELYVDKWGRVKVQFHWDRRGTLNEQSSCWVRVSSGLAGSGYGFVSHPRVGQEVIVEFLEGDPDRPIITGCVYNSDNKPPYTLPDHKTVTTFKSRSSKKGGESNFNELRFEDKKGSEQVFLHAEKDMDLRVKGTARRHVSGSDNDLVGGSHFLHVGGKENCTVDGDSLSKVGGDVQVTVDGKHVEKVGGDLQVKAGTAVSFNAGSTFLVEGAMQVQLKCGGSMVDIGPAGVTITGPLVRINSGPAPPVVSVALPPTTPGKPAKADDGKNFGPG